MARVPFAFPIASKNLIPASTDFYPSIWEWDKKIELEF